MSVHEARPVRGSAELQQGRLVRGRTFILVLVVTLLAVFAVNYLAAKHNAYTSDRLVGDARAVADPVQATQTWTRRSDGMTLRVVPVGGADTVAMTTIIRRYLKQQRVTNLTADYADPRFGSSDLPGRADLEFGTAHKLLNVRYSEVPGGAELRWITTDSVMKSSLKDWAAKVGSSPVVG